MKRILLLFSYLLTITVIDAQTIHWLTFIDTQDRLVGNVDKVGRKVLRTHFIDEVNAALAPKGYKSDIQDYYDSRLSPENCKAAVENLSVQSEDIIVFYYIGHGGRPETNDANYIKAHPYPQMCMGVHLEDEKKFIPLEWVYKQLSGKGARLAVIIGMCCNSPTPISMKDAPRFSPNYGVTYMSNNKLMRIQDLFLGVKGSVLATSASPGQTSGCFKTEHFGEVDCYTTVLCDIFDNYLDNISETLTWNQLLKSISYIIDKNTSHTQTPIHDTSHLTSTTKPSDQRTKPEPVPTPSDKVTGDKWKNKITGLFDALINNQNDEEERLSMKDVVEGLFTSNAQVKILGQDSETTVDKENASVYLGRLATSRLLLKVSVVDGELDNTGHISSLKVREVYKK